MHYRRDWRVLTLDRFCARYTPLLERLEYRRQERDRVRKNLEACLRMEADVRTNDRPTTTT